MLASLSIRDIVLIDTLDLTFDAGLSALTGETGAGKSIIVGALALLRGARGRAELVRDGEGAAIIDAQFEPRSNSKLVEMLADHGLDVLRGHCDDVGRDYHEIDKTTIFPISPSSTVDDIVTTANAMAALGFTSSYVFATGITEPARIIELFAEAMPRLD